MRHQPYFEGPPQFNVGLKPIAAVDWLLPDDQADWLTSKNKLIDTLQEDIFVELAGSRPAQFEAAQLIGLACNQTIAKDEAPLLAASRLISDDLVIMENKHDVWTTTACCLCSPTFFSAQHAIGKSLKALHDPVPDGDYQLAARIGRVFTNLTSDTILERHNWTVQWSNARFTPNGAPLRDQAEHASVSEAATHLFLRVERQTIRRLSATGAVLFTIRIRLTPVARLLSDPNQRDAFAHAWQNAPPPIRRYKKWAVLERHVDALLRAPLA